MDNATFSEEVTTALNFEVEDRDTPLQDLTLAGRSSNPAVIPDAGILFTGTGSRRAVILSPRQPGSTTITVSVSDGRASASRSFTVAVTPRAAQSPALLLSAVVSEQPAPAVRLVFPTDTAAREYRVHRKTRDASTWGPALATLPGRATDFTDTQVAPGSAYEYQVVKNLYSPAYLYAGIRAPMTDRRGAVILVVDKAYSADAPKELSRLERDLAGDGWKVIRHDVSRQDTPLRIKQIIQADYDADPARVKSVFLLGHVPVAYSGWYSPDGHHERALPADVFYADLDGEWSDELTGNVQPLRPETRNYPGDGRYDQSTIPSPVELQIGRVDLFNMPGFLPKGEKELLRQYLDKDHHFRHAMLRVEKRGLADGWTSSSLPNQAAMFGPSRVAHLPWFPTLNSESFLWASRAYYANYRAFNDNGATTADFASRDPRTVFVEMAGSYFGEWDIWDDLLRAPLGTPTYTLTASWHMPAWRFHHMALGETAGYAAKVTQNNPGHGGLYSIGDGNSRRVHIALMGDPTLRLHAVAPVSELVPLVQRNQVRLEWKESPDAVEGYHVYRSSSAAGPFLRLTPSLIKDTQFAEENRPPGTYTYMVRAVKLEVSGSGTYYNPSQGIMRTIPVTGAADTRPPVVSVTAPVRGASVWNPIKMAAAASDDGGLAKVEFSLDGTPIGTLTEEPYSWEWDASAIAAGAHDLAVKAVDFAGNPAVDTVRVNLLDTDAVAPRVTVAEPLEGQKVWGNIRVRAQAEDNAAMDRVELRIDDKVISTARTAPYDFLWKTCDPLAGKPIVADGLHRIKVTAYDHSGNRAEQSVAVTFASALARPTVLLNTPATLVAQAGGVVELAYNWQGGPADQEWVVFSHFVDPAGKGLASEAHSPPLPAHYWSGSYSYPVQFRIKRSLPPGRYRIMTGLFRGAERLPLNAGPGVVPDDEFRYQTGTLTIMADTTPPRIPFVSLKPRQRVAGKVNFSIRAVDNVQVDRVDFLIDGQTHGSIRVSPNYEGKARDNIDNLFYTGSYTWDTVGVTNGLHKVALRAIDSAGNQADLPLEVLVSNPMVYQAAPAEVVARAGEEVRLAYHWSGGPTVYPAQVTTEFISEATGRIAFRTSHSPIPSPETWTGDDVTYSHTVTIPPDTAPGRYRIAARMTSSGGGYTGLPISLVEGPGVSPMGSSALSRYQIGTLTVVSDPRR